MKGFLKTSWFSRNANEMVLKLSGDRWRKDRHQQYFTVIKCNVIKSMIVNSKSIYMNLGCLFLEFTAIDWAFKPVKKERYLSKVAQQSQHVFLVESIENFHIPFSKLRHRCNLFQPAVTELPPSLPLCTQVGIHCSNTSATYSYYI